MSEQQSKPQKSNRTTRNIVIAVVAGIFVLALGAGAFLLTSMTVMDGSLRGREGEGFREELLTQKERELSAPKGILFVVKDIPEGAEIHMEDLETRTLTADKIPANAVTEPKLVVGRHATAHIFQGEDLTDDKLDSPKSPPAKKSGKEAK